MKLFNITDKVAIVTGGNGGIGLGIVQGLAEAGAKVAIVARNEDKSRQAARTVAAETGYEPLVITADVSRPEQVASAVATVNGKFGRIDIVFNNAGINIRKPPQTLSAEEWHTVLDVNLTSAFLMSKEVYPSMKRAGGGKIINIG